MAFEAFVAVDRGGSLLDFKPQLTAAFDDWHFWDDARV